MIVTSKRVFINVLAQFMTPQDLLRATYYVVDVSNRGHYMEYEKEVVYHDDGSYEIKSRPKMHNSSISRFNIIYGTGWMNPAYVINATSANTIGSNIDIEMQNKDPLQLYIESLKKPNTILGVRDWLYNKLNFTQRGKGIRIFMIMDEDVVRGFGHAMCCYLSKFFGEDIKFLDAQYRPQLVKGYVDYKGDKEFARKIARDISDYELMTKVTALVSQGGLDGMSNLMEYLNCMDMNALFHTYELLFPREPLPRGNYEPEQIKQIIAGKCAERIGVQYPSTRNQSLFTIDEYMSSINDEIENVDWT